MNALYTLILLFAIAGSHAGTSAVMISDINTESVSWRNEIMKMYRRTYSEGYKRNQLLTYYKSSCTGHENGLHMQCIRDKAAKRGLGSALMRTTSLKEVCCFFWDTFECSEILACKPLWKQMYEFYIEDRIKAHCDLVPKESILCAQVDDRARTSDMSSDAELPVPERPTGYGVKQNIINFFRQITTRNNI